MTKTTIDPGVCGFIAQVESVTDDGMEVKLTVQTDCQSVTRMIEELGDTYNAYEICLCKPGSGVFYEYASAHEYDSHCACPVISGIIKTIEASCQLALPRNVSVTFED